VGKGLVRVSVVRTGAPVSAPPHLWAGHPLRATRTTGAHNLTVHRALLYSALPRVSRAQLGVQANLVEAYAAGGETRPLSSPSDVRSRALSLPARAQFYGNSPRASSPRRHASTGRRRRNLPAILVVGRAPNASNWVFAQSRGLSARGACL